MTEVQAGAAVLLRGLHRGYKDVRAVDGVDLTIGAGEVVALLGPNGAGKSTAIDMLLGLTRPDRGEVAVFGRTPRRAVAEGLVGAMLQSGGLPDDITAGEVVRLIAALFPHPLPVRETLERAGVADVAKQRFGRLSGGQKQRVRFAAALVGDPDLLVLDEPTVAMDVQARREFWAAMRSFTATGRTVLFATHYLAEAEEFADRVVLLRAGRVVADGSVAQVRALVAGRIVSATVSNPDLAGLELLPGVSAVRVEGSRIHLTCSESDSALRALLAACPYAADIEVVAHGLEDAFVMLTQESVPGAETAPLASLERTH
ncbi:MAG: ABC transporter ATP-binding protein [Pseudonocardiales bacterium]|nr:ABC transporter ATP-binding protein [Pseudonocardiales bacterium]